MPAVNLEPMEWSATEAGSAFQLGFFSDFFPPFLFPPVLQFNLLALSTSAVRTRGSLGMVYSIRWAGLQP